MNYNLDDYEPVEERIKRFYKDHPTGCLLSKLESSPDNTDYAVFSAEIVIDDKVRARGWAQEIRDKELSMTRDGKEYESINYSSWLENAETSAVGRALANFNYTGSKRASREEVQKASNRVNRAPVPPNTPDTKNLEDALLALLAGADGILSVADTAKLRELIPKHRGDATWFRDAIKRTEDATKKQEALLAANTSGKTSDPEPAKETLTDAANVGWEKPAKE